MAPPLMHGPQESPFEPPLPLHLSRRRHAPSRRGRALGPALMRPSQESPLEPPLSLHLSRRRQAPGRRWLALAGALMRPPAGSELRLAGSWCCIGASAAGVAVGAASELPRASSEGRLRLSVGAWPCPCSLPRFRSFSTKSSCSTSSPAPPRTRASSFEVVARKMTSFVRTLTS